MPQALRILDLPLTREYKEPYSTHPRPWRARLVVLTKLMHFPHLFDNRSLEERPFVIHNICTFALLPLFLFFPKGTCFFSSLLTSSRQSPPLGILSLPHSTLSPSQKSVSRLERLNLNSSPLSSSSNLPIRRAVLVSRSQCRCRSDNLSCFSILDDQFSSLLCRTLTDSRWFTLTHFRIARKSCFSACDEIALYGSDFGLGHEVG